LNGDKSNLDMFWFNEEPRILETKMVNSRVKIAFSFILSGCLLAACATIKEAGRIIGHTTRDVTRAIGHGTRDAAKTVGEGVKKIVKSAPDDEW
jgi:predicted small secreted protein